jgi:mono/diheme cytochrome c family protein
MPFRVPLILLFMTADAASAPPEYKTVWTGVYSAAQAARGQAVYAAACSRCHKEDLSGYRGVLRERFMDQWSEDSLNSFFTILRQTMPANAAGSLKENEYLDIVAYVLRMNDFPAGPNELTSANIRDIRVEGKDGPAPVPDFALVQVVGCMKQEKDGSWTVTNASEPVRTRDPGDPAANEMQVLRIRPMGSHTFHLLDFAGVQAHPEADRKVEVKGLLIRKTGDDKLNPSSVQSVAPTCAAP